MLYLLNMYAVRFQTSVKARGRFSPELMQLRCFYLLSVRERMKHNAPCSINSVYRISQQLTGMMTRKIRYDNRTLKAVSIRRKLFAGGARDIYGKLEGWIRQLDCGLLIVLCNIRAVLN